MTVKEAIQAMKFYKEKLYNGIFNDKIDAFDVTISALEKQIPKKVEEYLTSSFCCPVCTNVLSKYSIYCSNCGQALDWSDNE